MMWALLACVVVHTDHSFPDPMPEGCAVDTPLQLRLDELGVWAMLPTDARFLLFASDLSSFGEVVYPTGFSATDSGWRLEGDSVGLRHRFHGAASEVRGAADSYACSFGNLEFHWNFGNTRGFADGTFSHEGEFHQPGSVWNYDIVESIRDADRSQGRLMQTRAVRTRGAEGTAFWGARAVLSGAENLGQYCLSGGSDFTSCDEGAVYRVVVWGHTKAEVVWNPCVSDCYHVTMEGQTSEVCDPQYY